MRKYKQKKSALDQMLDFVVKQKFAVIGALAIVLVATSGVYFTSQFQKPENSIGIYALDVVVPSIEEAYSGSVAEAKSENHPQTPGDESKEHGKKQEANENMTAFATFTDKGESEQRENSQGDESLNADADVNTSGSNKALVSNVYQSAKMMPEIFKISAIEVYQLNVNGVAIANFKSEQDGNTVLEKLKNKFNEEESEIVEVAFFEDVKIEKSNLDIVNFHGFDVPDEMLAYIEKGTKEERTHKVKKGENYWTIAQLYGITPEDLERANPGVVPERLQIDQMISLVVPKPLISVRTVEKIQYSEDIAYDVVYENSSNLYKGEVRTKSNGVYGEKSIVANLIKENGLLVSKEIVSEDVISKPVAKVVYKGTKNPPPRMGTGVMSYPLSVRGRVTSEFGATKGRAFPHQGIDIGVRSGTPVLAADGGVVIAAGWATGYGYRVMINHGANIVTLYGHCSSVAVSVGDQVFKGQTVAYSGSTGWSTGPHLHFEVRLNNIKQNPRNYVNF